MENGLQRIRYLLFRPLLESEGFAELSMCLFVVAAVVLPVYLRIPLVIFLTSGQPPCLHTSTEGALKSLGRFSCKQYRVLQQQVGN